MTCWSAEDDLIDDSLNGKLSSHEFERLNGYFLATEERQRNGILAVLFVNSFNRPRATTRSLLEVYPPFSPAHRLLMMSAVVFSGSGNVVRQNRWPSKQIADAGQKREELGRQLDDRQPYLQTFEKAIAAARVRRHSWTLCCRP